VPVIRDWTAQRHPGQSTIFCPAVSAGDPWAVSLPATRWQDHGHDRAAEPLSHRLRPLEIAPAPPIGQRSSLERHHRAVPRPGGPNTTHIGRRTDREVPPAAMRGLRVFKRLTKFDTSTRRRAWRASSAEHLCELRGDSVRCRYLNRVGPSTHDPSP